MKLRFLVDALVEYEDAIAYYERAQSGLGEAFLHNVEETLALTLEFPEIGVLVANTPPDLGVRRRIIQRFEVEVNYLVVGDELTVLAIFHGKRRPGYWHDRLVDSASG